MLSREFFRHQYPNGQALNENMESSSIITSDENFRDQRNRSKIIGHDKSEHINSQNSGKLRFPGEKIEKSRASLGKTISNFIGNLASELIFYRKIPLGAPHKE